MPYRIASSLPWLLILSSSLPILAQTTANRTTDVGYDQVRAVLKKHCVGCHNPDELRGGLDLSSLESIQAGSDSGPAIVAGKPDESSLLLAATHQMEPRMPPNKPRIPQRELDIIRRWIAAGIDSAVYRAPTTPSVDNSKPLANSPQRQSPQDPNESHHSSIRTLPIRTAITGLATHPAKPWIAISGNRQIVCGDIDERSWKRAIDVDGRDVTALKYSRSGNVLVAGVGIAGQSGRVIGINATTGSKLFELGDESDTVLTLDISSDNKLVVLGGAKRNAKVYRVEDGNLLQTLRWHTDWVLAVAFSPDNLLVASGDRFGGLRIWDTETGEPFQTLRGHTAAITGLLWSEKSDRLISSSLDGTVRTWDLHHGVEASQIDAVAGGLLAIAGDDTSSIVVGGRHKSIRMISGGQLQDNHYEMPDEVIHLGAASQNRFVAADASGSISIFEVKNSDPLYQMNLPVDRKLAVEFSRKLAEMRESVEVQIPSSTVDAITERSVDESTSEFPQHLLSAAEQAVRASEESIQQTERALNRMRETHRRLEKLIQEIKAQKAN